MNTVFDKKGKLSVTIQGNPKKVIQIFPIV